MSFLDFSEGGVCEGGSQSSGLFGAGGISLSTLSQGWKDGEAEDNTSLTLTRKNAQTWRPSWTMSLFQPFLRNSVLLEGWKSLTRRLVLMD